MQVGFAWWTTFLIQTSDLSGLNKNNHHLSPNEMKTRNIPLVLMYTLGVLALSTCQRVEPEFQATGTAPQNKANMPMEQVGMIHNNILDALAARTDFPDLVLDGSDEAKADACLAVGLQKIEVIFGTWEGVNRQDILDGYSLLVQDQDFTGLGKEMLDQGHITAYDKTRFDVFQQLAFQNTVPSLEAYQQRLMDFEHAVGKNPRVSRAGGLALQMGSVVLRYSSEYWIGVDAKGPDHPWYAIAGTGKELGVSPIPVQWPRIVKDVAGFIRGFLMAYEDTNDVGVSTKLGILLAGRASAG